MKGETNMKKKIWYAVLRDNERTDHSTGSFRKREAIKMARQLRKDGYPEAYIAVLDDETDYCYDEIRDF